MDDRLTKFYGELSPSLDAITALLSASGVDVSEVRARDLYDRDLDCHNIGMHVMLEVIAAVVSECGPPGEEDLVLDIGCGLGGPGRLLVDRFGCSVLGIDVLPLRVELARALTELTGMADRITYRVADATDVDLADESCSHVWMVDVGVHIRDKVALFGEIARVLKPGGLLVMHDQTGPLPKTMAPLKRRAPYHALSLPQLVRTVEHAGMRLLTWRDTTDLAVDYFRRMKALLDAAEPPPTAGDRRQRDRGNVVLTAYLETLSGPEGRTGILVARRTPQSLSSTMIS